MNLKIAIVLSKFNEEITGLMKIQALKRAEELGIVVELFEVPGAIEIPIIAKKLALSKKYKSIVTLGAVIRGETSHYDYVCYQVSYGCQKVALTCDIPVIFGVLTCDNETQAYDRINGKVESKPQDVIDCAKHMIELIDDIEGK